MAGERHAIAIIGGTGALGAALAKRWAKLGYPVIIGSRDAERARTSAAALSEEAGRAIRAATNRAAAEAGDIVIITVPYASHDAICADIGPAVAGKIVVDTTVPLVPPKVMRVQLPAEGSAALAAQRILGDRASVVSALHTVAAHRLAAGDSIDGDVLVFGDKRDARAQVIALIEALGLRALHGGPLANSAAAEALTSVLIFINRTYAVDGAGLRITGDLKAPKEP
ncbi:MAG: NADPH-dependent F420 reductase [Alphaproteobacteria bacterium]